MFIFANLVWCAIVQAAPSPSFPPPGITLPEYWGEEHVWWHGRASFKGQVIAPACTLAMEDTWQAVDMGETPVRDLQDSSVGPEKKFRLRLRNCELA
ncbi:fimbrial protein, partial [Escherichia coli]|nr:fimbrial protein [Escherichia coli]